MAWLDTKTLMVVVCSLGVVYCSCPQPVLGKPDPPCCQRTWAGVVNTYTPLHKCTYFRQTAPGFAPGTHRCPTQPKKQLFSTRTCRCEFAVNVNCHPGHGVWGHWKTISACIGPCGFKTGYKVQTRTCIIPTCQGPSHRTISCVTGPCITDGGWGPWTTTKCIGPCGGKPGYKIRTRLCNNPPPSGGGKPCQGPSQTVIGCVTAPCTGVVNGGWGPWTTKTAWCIGQCGGKTGYKVQTRACNNPPPSGGGKYCQGPSQRTISCLTAPCKAPCVDPHDGKNSACCERVWPVNADVNRYTPKPGTNCVYYKHEALGNVNVPPVTKKCPGTSWFNTKKCDCDYGPLVGCRY